ncbi:radical SAM family heme chaperone HemW [Sedimentibacter sp. MB31-C6]|uniref:radical SAM family heme chaperone HemW n=1 Tax=Sedimentibacter sp. MB31-C6 TaxID=3109366 RepID=UPI002DDCA213|nr:radical SAM family heme chaperone HemW [Sedimentibacter sp. MB36-C1]WSI03797.1 radical SAM family heme chaperone HemW [Sedimentibacter sp. MB36-C1]
MKKLGIYIHIPFCKSKCNYCDFYSISWNKEAEKRYIEAVINEIRIYNESLETNYVVDTIYFGGGTPTIISPLSLSKILDEIKRVFKVEKNSEISIEANPNTLLSNNLSFYRNIGINRLSIGVQSLNDDLLYKIGRIHNSKEALDSIDRAIINGFSNINVDVMFNIPGQTVKNIENTLSEIIKHNINHISFYSLKLEKGTPLFVMEKKNKLIMPEEDVEREMYYCGRNVMENNNLFQYEISNFAKKNYECKHNLKYWNQEEYIGLGPSAHSFLNMNRYSNSADLNNYCLNLVKKTFERNIHEILNYEDMKFEYIMLQLRLNKGLSICDFNKKFLIDFNTAYSSQIEYLIKNNLLEYKGDNIRLTKKGMDISNYVFTQFM